MNSTSPDKTGHDGHRQTPRGAAVVAMLSFTYPTLRGAALPRPHNT
ncbi:hypothetical protein [Rhodococcus qingshengii]|nr:hypothetical protein [Rhodococcus qingshengii]QXC42070.1 hypothetical protein KSE96_23815 [Rhodococcus qingshengii]